MSSLDTSKTRHELSWFVMDVDTTHTPPPPTHHTHSHTPHTLTHTTHRSKIRALEYSVQTRLLLSSSDDGMIGVWNLDIERQEVM